MSNLKPLETLVSGAMATRDPAVLGIDHPTVVPTNAESDADEQPAAVDEPEH